MFRNTSIMSTSFQPHRFTRASSILHCSSHLHGRRTEESSQARPEPSLHQVHQIGLGDWDDLSGLLLPVSEEERIIKDLKDGNIETIQELIERFESIDANYREYQWTWTYKMICDYYGISEITLEDANRIHEDYIKARRSWIAEIKKDAEKEFAMGDVEEEVFRNFVDSLTRK